MREAFPGRSLELYFRADTGGSTGTISISVSVACCLVVVVRLVVVVVTGPEGAFMTAGPALVPWIGAGTGTVTGTGAAFRIGPGPGAAARAGGSGSSSTSTSPAASVTTGTEEGGALVLPVREIFREDTATGGFGPFGPPP